MSFEAISWALKQDISRTTEKFCLVMMANYAGHDGLCYPSIERLSMEMSQDRKTVIKSIQSLVESGYLEDTSHRVGSTKSIVVYRLVGFPTEENINYMYKITNPETGEYYVGIRSCSCDPQVDPYLGSGVWVKEMKEENVFLEKTILKTFDTYEEARAEESKFFRSMKEDDGLCQNRQTNFRVRLQQYAINDRFRERVDSGSVFPIKVSQKRYTEPVTITNTIPSELEDPVLSIFDTPEKPPVDNTKAFWDQAVGMLTSLGVAKATVNSFVGRCLKMTGQDQEKVMDAIQAAVDAEPHDAIPYIVAILGGNKKKTKTAKQKEIEDAFAKLEAASERRKAQWVIELGENYTGEGGSEDIQLLQPEPHTQPIPVVGKRSEGVGTVPRRSSAQISRPSRGYLNEGEVSADHF